MICHTPDCPSDCATLPVNMPRSCQRLYFAALEERRKRTPFDERVYGPEFWPCDWMDEAGERKEEGK